MRARHAAVAALVLLATACGQASMVTIRIRRPDVQVASAATGPLLRHPLTGVPHRGAPEWTGRRALAIKVENSPQSRPQSGLLEADIVYEQIAEGGITRFIAVFHSTPAHAVGPVRSARSVDPHVLAPYEPLFAYSGAVPQVVASIRATRGVLDVGAERDASSYYRRVDRRAPHNLYTSTSGLWDGRDGEPPRAQFAFGDDGAAQPGGATGLRAEMAFGSRETVVWTYDSSAGRYVRSHGDAPHRTDDGQLVTADNVLVQFVGVTGGSVVDASGNVSPETRVLGAGDAVLLSGGQARHGSWRRTSQRAPTTFTGNDGAVMRLRPGRTWVELLPNGSHFAAS